MKRIKIYEKAGVNRIFIPYITKGKDLKKVAVSTNLYTINTLTYFDVKRMSMGLFGYNSLMEEFKKFIVTLLRKQSYDSLFVGRK